MISRIEILEFAWNRFHAGDNENAEQCCRHLLTGEPHDGGALLLRGMICQRQGKLDEANLCFQEVLRLRPDDAIARHHLYNLADELQMRRRFPTANEAVSPSSLPVANAEMGGGI